MALAALELFELELFELELFEVGISVLLNYLSWDYLVTGSYAR